MSIRFECSKTNNFGIMFGNKSNPLAETPAPVFHVGGIGSPSRKLCPRIVSCVDGVNCFRKEARKSGSVFWLVGTHIHYAPQNTRMRSTWTSTTLGIVLHSNSRAVVR